MTLFAGQHSTPQMRCGAAGGKKAIKTYVNYQPRQSKRSPVVRVALPAILQSRKVDIAFFGPAAPATAQPATK